MNQKKSIMKPLLQSVHSCAFYRICISCLILFHVCIKAQSEIRFTWITTWGEEGQGPGQFRNPGGISINAMGDLYVADTGNQRIQKLDSQGRFLTEIGGFGWQAEQFDGPIAVHAMNLLDVFVADYSNDRIQRFDKDLHFLAVFQPDESWDESVRFGFPLDVAMSGQGELMILDGENFRILKLDVYGNPQRSFGDFDAGAGRLVRPRRLLVTRDERVLVSDAGIPGILLFDTHGNYLDQWGNAVLKSPQDMAELHPYILVADSEEGIVVLDLSGRPAGFLKDIPEGGFRFRETVDVAVFDRLIYILDRQRNAVDVFRWETISEGGY